MARPREHRKPKPVITKQITYRYYTSSGWQAFPEASCVTLEAARCAKEEIVKVATGVISDGVEVEVEVLIDLSLVSASGFYTPLRREELGKVSFDPVSPYDAAEFTVETLPVPSEDLPDQACMICLAHFTDKDVDGQAPVRLEHCKGHYFHADCLHRWLAMKSQCPYCQKSYGVVMGTGPPGSMLITWSDQRLAGFEGEASRGMWIIDWNMPDGIQQAYHPRPGTPFRGTSRRGYLPDTPAFTKILKMFQIAWKRRLMFSVGTSLTNGQSNVVTWSSIHVRSEMGQKPFGWPAPGYLESVTQELKHHGVTEDQIESLYDV